MRLWILLFAWSAAVAGEGVEGYVVDAVTGAPIEGAYFFARGSSPNGFSARTDASGHFRIEERSSGAVVRAGYLTAQWSWSQNKVLAMTPQAVISGTIEDEDGFPVSAEVVALHYQLVNGERKLVAPGLRPWVRSDDQGHFRVYGLRAGRYRLGVTPGSGWDRRYVPQFFPGGLEPGDSDLFEVKAGQELSGIELRIRRYEGVTVSGRVTGLAGGAVRLSVMLQSNTGSLHGSYQTSARNDGSFTIPHVPPGAYTLLAQSGRGYPPRAGEFLAQQRLQVATDDVRGLTLALREVQPIDLAGTVIFEGGGKPAPVLISVSGGGPIVAAHSDENGSFVLKGLLPVRYHLNVFDDRRSAPTFTPISAQFGGKEVLHDAFDVYGPQAGPLRITVSFRQIPVSGTVSDSSGEPVAGAAVLLSFSGQPYRELWASTDEHGAFRSFSPMAGEFHVFVLRDPSQTDLIRDPEFVAAHEHDFPPVRLIDGPNPPLVLRMP